MVLWRARTFHEQQAGPTAVARGLVDLAVLGARREKVNERIEEVNADIRGYPSGLLLVSLPGRVIPAPARRDVHETDGNLVLLGRVDFGLERPDRRVQAQLQHRQ